ncbi:zinc-binding dehydrogenase [Mannheimia granulomatis]|uniref:zinc-binding dehydrogenase n=1 Tax=Mannheimia granulomatis TaxID=85402 RepID=UPI003AB98A60
MTRYYPPGSQKTTSQNPSFDAFRLGASLVVLSTDDEQMSEAANTFDLIIDTVPYTHDLKAYIPTLTLNGSLVLVGLIGELEQTINTVPMIMGRRSISASVIGRIKETQEMLDFCADHNIVADVEMIAMSEINTAYERMQKSDVKYRFVIEGSLKG